MAPPKRAPIRLKYGPAALAGLALTFAGLAAIEYVPPLPFDLDMMPAAGEVRDSAGHSECRQCHESPAAGLGKPAAPAGHDRICSSCHAGAAEAGHPIDFIPDRILPAGFTLSSDGRFSCSTCHALSGDRPARLQLRVSGGTICRSCHEDAFFAAMADGGASISMSAHFDTSGVLSAETDPFSPRCMSCHDEKGTTQTQIAVAGFSDLVPGGNAGAHSIGADYDSAARNGDFRPRTLLSQDILLPGGRVACVSCHVPYSREHGRPPTTSQGLCGECHIK